MGVPVVVRGLLRLQYSTVGLDDLSGPSAGPFPGFTLPLLLRGRDRLSPSLLFFVQTLHHVYGGVRTPLGSVEVLTAGRHVRN